VLLVALSVLGIAVFTLALQGRSRYLLTFVPLVVALAGMVRHRREERQGVRNPLATPWVTRGCADHVADTTARGRGRDTGH
jgi:hypothetical protein